MENTEKIDEMLQAIYTYSIKCNLPIKEAGKKLFTVIKEQSNQGL